MTNAGTDVCTVLLTAPAQRDGFTVKLTSSDQNVRLPGLVTVQSGSTSAAVTAVISAVTAPQSSTLRAMAGNVSRVCSIALGASKATLSVSARSLSFANVALKSTATQSLVLTSSGKDPVTVKAATLTGSGFTMSGPHFPLILNPGNAAKLTLQYHPVGTGSAHGNLTLASNSSTGSSTVVALTGTTASAAGNASLTSISCQASYMTGAGTNACIVRLSGAAPAAGVAVQLSSSDGNVKIPGAITVPSGASSAGFSAAVAAVAGPQSSTLRATLGNVSKVCSIALGPSKAALTLSAGSLSFGSVPLNTPATQSLVLTDSGTAAVTITAARLTGSGFRISSGPKFPLTLQKGQKTTLAVEFTPAKAGAAKGTLLVSSNDPSGGTMIINVSGAGAARTFVVDLSWDAPGKANSIAGYNVYRAARGSASYQLLNAAVNYPTTYEDRTVQAGASYDYIVESVGTDGAESAPSNVFSVTVE